MHLRHITKYLTISISVSIVCSMYSQSSEMHTRHSVIICSAQSELENVPQMHLRQGEETFVKSFFCFFFISF